MIHGVSVSLCSKGTPRGSSASGGSVTSTGIDGHPKYANTGGSTRARKGSPESRLEELTGKKEEEKKKSKRGPGSELKVGMLTQSSRNLGDGTEDIERTHQRAREDSEDYPEQGTVLLAAQQNSHQEYQLQFDQVKTRSANMNKSASSADDPHVGLTNIKEGRILDLSLIHI